MEQKINEELKQYKLFRIQEAEKRLQKYKEVYAGIKENVFSVLSKNITSSIIRWVFAIVAFIMLLVAVACLFPGLVIDNLYQGEEPLTSWEREDLITMLGHIKYIFFGFFILFTFIAYLLKINNRKRNVIFYLSELIEEVIKYLEDSLQEEKRKYEYFVDSLAESAANSSEEQKEDEGA